VYPEWKNKVILPLLPLELWAPCKACPLQFAKASTATLPQIYPALSVQRQLNRLFSMKGKARSA
jgi:hypothetical protein